MTAPTHETQSTNGTPGIDPETERAIIAQAREEADRALADAHEALEHARTVYYAVEREYDALDRVERPMIGYLTQLEVPGARLAAQALGRDIEKDHWPAVRWRVAPTAEGSRTLYAKKRERDAAEAQMTQAAELVVIATVRVGSLMTDEERARNEAREMAAYETLDDDARRQYVDDAPTTLDVLAIVTPLDERDPLEVAA